jgi:hypothetical protein
MWETRKKFNEITVNVTEEIVEGFKEFGANHK